MECDYSKFIINFIAMLVGVRQFDKFSIGLSRKFLQQIYNDFC